MGEEINQSQDFGEWLVRVLLSIGALALMFYLIAKNGLTGREIVETHAGAGLIPVLAIELIDKKFDKRSFWAKLTKRDDYRFILVAVSIFLIYIMLISILTGQLIIDVSKAPVSAHIVALLMMFYLLSPETGSSEWLLFGYIASNLATGFTQFSLAPGLSMGFLQGLIPQVVRILLR